MLISLDAFGKALRPGLEGERPTLIQSVLVELDGSAT
jgi:hypothetical protein